MNRVLGIGLAALLGVLAFVVPLLTPDPNATDYGAKLAAAGFEAVVIEPTRVYDIEDARQFLTAEGIDVDAIAPQVADKFMSAFVRATKPAKAACCAPGCCS